MKTRIKVGDRFGKLTVLELGERFGGTHYFDRVKCECGNEVRIRRASLQGGHAISCGCVLQAHRDGWGERLTKHGKSRSQFYQWWLNRRRKRGKLCPEWEVDFGVMLKDVGDWMEGMGLKPYRPDRTRPFGPGNFIWQ
jgi:hypothetical protein